MADELNFQVAAVGFGSYLDGIIPNDIAIAAGAFAATMQQIKNIENSDFEKFAQVVNNIETSKGLDLIGGTDVPVNLPLANQGQTLTALGSGPYGTYTMSDFFGCMSGLPYMWKDLQGSIQELTTPTLENIYHELFLAVTWEQATSSLALEYDYEQVTPFIPQPDPELPGYPGTPATYQRKYRIASITLLDNGGGYGRGTAPAPTVSFVYGAFSSDSASATTTIGTNDADAGSLGTGTFGRVTSLNFSIGSFVNYGSIVPAADGMSGPPTMPGAGAPIANSDIQIRIQAPPTVQPGIIGPTLPTGYSNQPYGTTGWPSPMNGVIYGSATSYVNQANQEIAYIKSRSPLRAKRNNVIYDACGLQLMREQRARYTGLPPVPAPTRDVWLNLFPTALYVFTDSVPTLGLDTNPHMSAQTLEAISNLSTVGGQSVIGMMRESRNENRMVEIGVELDNQIPNDFSAGVGNLLLVNGTVPVALSGIPVVNINGNTANSVTNYTLPSVLVQTDNNGNLITPSPIGYIDPNIDKFIVTPLTVPYEQNSPIDNILSTETASPNGDNVLGPYGDGTGPNRLGDPAIAVVTAGAANPIGIGGNNGLGVPNTGNAGTILDQGQAVLPGSFAGSKYQNLIPNTLNTTLSSGNMLPAAYSVQEAIEQVILCNCDCWVD